MPVIVFHDSIFSRYVELRDLFASQSDFNQGDRLYDFNIKRIMHRPPYKRAVIVGNPDAQEAAVIRHYLQRNNKQMEIQKILFSDVIGTASLGRHLLIHQNTLLVSAGCSGQEVIRLSRHWLSAIRREHYGIVRFSQREQLLLQHQESCSSPERCSLSKKQKFLQEMDLSRLAWRLRLPQPEVVYRLWQLLADEQQHYSQNSSTYSPAGA
ncbi:MAG: hypothetical protein ACRC5A_10060 [Enterobacteriaceae bacterium]